MKEFILLLLLMIITSCKIDVKKNEELKKVDSLKLEVNKNMFFQNKTIIKKLLPFKKIDIDSIRNIFPNKEIINEGDLEIIFLNDKTKYYVHSVYDIDNGFYKETWLDDSFKQKILYKSYSDIRYKWMVDIDNNGEFEIIRAEGWEDGIDYWIERIDGKENIKKIFYFNPIIKKGESKFYWGYPWNIKEVYVNKEKLLVSFDKIERDDEYKMSNDQIKLVNLIFKGEITETNNKKEEINLLKLLSIKEIQKRIANSSD